MAKSKGKSSGAASATRKKSGSAKKKKESSGKGKGKRPTRRSTRASQPPIRFEPSSYADVPSQVEEMVHLLAIEASRNSTIPMNAEAITELEQALNLRCRCFTCACASALRDGRDESQMMTLKMS